MVAEGGGGVRPWTIVKSWAIGWFFWVFFWHSHQVPVKGDSTSRGNAKHHTTQGQGRNQFAISKKPLFLVRFVCLLVRSTAGQNQPWVLCFASLQIVVVNNVLTTHASCMVN